MGLGEAGVGDEAVLQFSINVCPMERSPAFCPVSSDRAALADRSSRRAYRWSAFGHGHPLRGSARRPGWSLARAVFRPELFIDAQASISDQRALDRKLIRAEQTFTRGCDNNAPKTLAAI
jgi:hypothetical protein